MRRKLITTATLGVLTLFGATLGYGQTLHRSFELSAMGGIRVYDEDVVFLSSGWVAGGKLAWFPHANIGVEGTVSFSSADVSLEEAGGDETDFTVDVTEVRVDGVYQMLFQAEQKFVPYFSAGVGQMVFDAGEESGVTDEPVTNLTYGGGIKFFFTPRIALRLDARDNVALIDKTFASESGIPTPNTKTFQANNPEFQAGLTIGFGGSDEGFGVEAGEIGCRETPGPHRDQPALTRWAKSVHASRRDRGPDGLPDRLGRRRRAGWAGRVPQHACGRDGGRARLPDGLGQRRRLRRDRSLPQHAGRYSGRRNGLPDRGRGRGSGVPGRSVLVHE